jgi:hypothetical protein
MYHIRIFTLPCLFCSMYYVPLLSVFPHSHISYFNFFLLFFPSYQHIFATSLYPLHLRR